MSDEYGQTLAAFVLDKGKQSRRLLKRIQEIDDVDPNVKIVDAAIADRTQVPGQGPSDRGSRRRQGRRPWRRARRRRRRASSSDRPVRSSVARRSAS